MGTKKIRSKYTTQVERILESKGVKIQEYHGGTLTGGAIILLLNNHHAIMNKIEAVAVEAIDYRSHDSKPLRPPSITDFRKTLNSIENCLRHKMPCMLISVC